MNMAGNKAAARKAAFARRAQAHKLAQPDIVAPVLQVVNEANIIAAYMPIRSEINPLPAMTALCALGKIVGVPVILGDGQPLEFHEWYPDCPMIDGPFGAKIPQSKISISPDLILAPLVAYDAQGTRLGYGGGFYDRTLEKLRAQKPVRYIGLAYNAQFSNMPLPREATDIALDGVITEQGATIFAMSE